MNGSLGFFVSSWFDTGDNSPPDRPRTGRADRAPTGHERPRTPLGADVVHGDRRHEPDRVEPPAPDPGELGAREVAGAVEQGVLGGSLGLVYKEVWYVDEAGPEYPKLKLGGDKSTWPGKKEIYRQPNWEEDVIQLAHEPRPDNYQRLLRPVMRNGEMIPGSLPPLSEIRELAQQNLASLPQQYRELTIERPYPVRFSDSIQSLRKQAAQLVGKEI